MSKVVVTNRGTGVESEFTEDQWNKVKDSDDWKNTFTVKTPSTKKAPPEVQAMQAQPTTAATTQPAEAAITAQPADGNAKANGKNK